MTISGQLAGLYEYRAALESKIGELETKLQELVGAPEEIPFPDSPKLTAPVLVPAVPVVPAPVPVPTSKDPVPLTIAAAEGGQVYSITDSAPEQPPAKRRGRPPGSKNKIQ